MIEYTNDMSCVNENMLRGFFVGWKKKPSGSVHMAVLKNSYKAWVAIDKAENRVVGFINAVSDGVLSAYIPLIEVLPEYQNNGIGAELVRRMLASLKHLYMVDLLCDEEMQGYYAKHGMMSSTGVILRNYDCIK